MKKRMMRLIALALVLTLTATALFACGKKSKPKETDPLANQNDVVTEPVQSDPVETGPLPGSEEWLAENMENARSLLGDNYEQAIEILLAMQEQMVDDPDYNALLYIAYMLRGSKDDAKALLNNPNLDKNAFADAVLENAEALGENEEIAKILAELMEHMMALGESDPVAFEAAARIGAVVQNNDPSDPTAYAVRYLAALAAGDEEAAKAIIEEAKANGISLEALKTTAIAYAEETNLTSVTVDEIEKGMSTTTTYNKGGEVVKSEVTQDNDDGTYSRTVKNSDGNVVGVALFNKKTNKPIRRTFYIMNRERTADNLNYVESYSGEYDVYEYSNGKISTLTRYDADNSVIWQIKLDSTGKVISARENGQEYTDQMLDVLKVVVENGELISITTPISMGNGGVRREEMVYSYVNPVGLMTAYKKYHESGELMQDMKLSYTFDDIAKGDYKRIEDIVYKNGIKDTTVLDYEKGNAVTMNVTWEEKVNGSYETTYMAVIDYQKHTFDQTYYTDGAILGTSHAELNENNTLLLNETAYDANGLLLYRFVATYDSNWVMTKEVDTYYDEQGRVTRVEVYGIDRKVDPEDPNNVTCYQYDVGGMMAQYKEYGKDKQITLERLTVYDLEGRVIKNEESTYEGGTQLTYNVTYYDYDEAGRRYFEMVEKWNMQTYVCEGYKNQDFYNGDQLIGKQYRIYDNELADYVLVRQDQYSYNEDGTLKTIDIFEVNNGEGTRVKQTNYFYENGVMTGYSVANYNSDRSYEVTYYNAKDQVYMIEKYDADGNLLEQIELDPATGEVIEPTEPVAEDPAESQGE